MKTLFISTGNLLATEAGIFIDGVLQHRNGTNTMIQTIKEVLSSDYKVTIEKQVINNPDIELRDCIVNIRDDNIIMLQYNYNVRR